MVQPTSLLTLDRDPAARPLAPPASPRAAALTLLAALLSLAACGGDDPAPASPDTAATSQDAAAADAAATDAAAADTSPADSNPGLDAGPAFDCPDFCGSFKNCAADVPLSLCVELCQAPDTTTGAQQCLTTSSDCDAFVDCMLGLKIPKPKPTRTFDEGATGQKFRDLAGDFTVPTTRGDWNFKAHYDGNDSYIFVFTGKGWYKASNGLDYGMKLHDDATPADLKQLLTRSPKNTHWFFIGYRDQTGTDNSAQYVNDFAKKFDIVLNSMTPVDRAYWKQRLHYVTAPAPIANEPITVPKNLGGWLGNYTRKKAPRVIAIDRYQRLRQIGLLSLVGQSKWFIYHLAYEAQYYDYEVARAKQFPTEGVKELVLLDNQVHKEPYLEIDLPPASEMATYDTLEIDHAQMCKDHDDSNCFEWDYLAWLKLVERPVKETNPYAKESCTVAVKEVKAAAEQQGACEAGANKGQACKAATDCPESKCVGYKPEVKPVTPVTGDTKPCQCITPRQETVDRAHTCTWKTKAKAEQPGQCVEGADKAKPCTADSECAGSTCGGYQAAVAGVTGYGGCGCQTIDLDVQRWVTTYRREGRWINDASHNLYHLAKGGTVRFKYKPAYPYTGTLKLRLRKTGQGPGAPSQVVPLFKGGPFGANYNDKYSPVEVEIPKDAKKVTLLLDVSGHGFGNDTANCAEFCNHTHHFTLKGAAGEKTWVRDQPFIGNNYGCADQVGDGVVPNQFGTWTLGRGGWCPGQEIPLTVWDVSSHAKPGQKVTVTYEGRLSGKPYVPVKKSGGTGFGGRIDMKSWLLIYK